MAFNNLFAGKKILVTGHTGFKGSWLTIWLQALGAKVCGLSIDVPSNPSLFYELELEKNIEHHFTDVRHAAEVEEIVTGFQPEFVFHLAAQPIVSVSYDDPLSTFETNMMGTANVLNALRKLTHPCIAVMITSDKCYDNVEWTWGYRENDALGGKDPYSASKGGAELVIKSFFHSYFNREDSPVRVATVRAGNVIGGGDWALNRIVPDCIRAWANDVAVTIRNPHSTRPWQHVLEPLSGYLRIAEKMAESEKLNGEAFNFGPSSDQSHTVLDLLKEISQSWKFKSTHEQFSVISVKTFHEAGLLKLNCDKALHALQWRSVLDFYQTSKMTGEWYNEFYNVAKDNMLVFTKQQIGEYEMHAKNKGLTWAL